MTDKEKAKLLAKEIKELANLRNFGTHHNGKPSAISIEKRNFSPATPELVLTELNKDRPHKRGIVLWTMMMGEEMYPEDVEPTLLAQSDSRTNVLYFRPKLRARRLPTTF